MKVFFVLLFFLVGITSYAQIDFQKEIQTQLIEAKSGDVIELPEGRLTLDVTLSLDGKSNVTVRGKGIEKTLLSFKNQISGAEGLKVTNSSGITLEDFTVQDTKGDAIKTQLVDGIIFKNVKAEWTGGSNEKNGGYGLYPVQCTQVLIDGCTATGASDAGIYVGQSKYIIVRNSKAYGNVAGIEIENSLHADVHNNEAFGNTGGILVFDLPDLIQKEGGFVRVYENNVHDNNLKNFAPKGNIVAKVPLGTGVMILATRNVELFENKIVNNRSVGTAIISYYMTENPINDKTYKPFPSNIFIHDNFYQRERARTTGKGRFGKMFRFKLRFGKDVPHIMYDGIENDESKEPRNICLDQNENATFINLDAANDFKGRNRSIEPFRCRGKSIDPVVLVVSK